jgi:hypothetical protein
MSALYDYLQIYSSSIVQEIEILTDLPLLPTNAVHQPVSELELLGHLALLAFLLHTIVLFNLMVCNLFVDFFFLPDFCWLLNLLQLIILLQ